MSVSLNVGVSVSVGANVSVSVGASVRASAGVGVSVGFGIVACSATPRLLTLPLGVAFGFTGANLTILSSNNTNNGAWYGGVAYVYTQSIITMIGCTNTFNLAVHHGGICTLTLTLNLTL